VLRRGEIVGPPAAGSGNATAAFDQSLETIFVGLDAGHVEAVGHRVVHGGSEFVAPALVDPRTDAAIERLAALAPLHNPSNLAGIRAARRRLPGVPQVAVFDTAFHQTMPEVARRYPLPQAVVKRLKIRRYGFHGINCAWCLSAAAAFYSCPPTSLNLIIAHLGAGASVSVIRAGRSIDTSMGMSPLEGLMMQTRSGDIDPAIVLALLQSGLAIDQVDVMLNRQSGVVALAGQADMRTVAERARGGDAHSSLAREMYAYRASKYEASYAGVAWPLDAIVFTGGIGENDATMRTMTCARLPHLGVLLDEAANAAGPGEAARSIADPGSSLDVLVIKAGEERQIARETIATIGA
jgi:acetate kinase